MEKDKGASKKSGQMRVWAIEWMVNEKQRNTRREIEREAVSCSDGPEEEKNERWHRNM